MSMYVLVYLFFNTLSIHVKLMNEMQIDKIQKKMLQINNRKKKKLEGGRRGGKIYT